MEDRSAKLGASFTLDLERDDELLTRQVLLPRQVT